MKTFIKSISPILFVVTLFIKKDAKKICFGAWFGSKYSGSPKYLFEYASSQSSVTVIWICKSDDLVREITAYGFKAYHAYSILGLYHQLTSKWFVCNVNCRDFNAFCMGFNSFLVNLGHGMPLKASFAERLSKFGKIIKFLRDLTVDRYKYIVVSSEFFVDVGMTQYSKRRDEVLILPEARCDGLLVDNQDFAKLRDTYDIPSDKHLALYMPTHRNEGKDIAGIKYALGQIEAVLSKLNNLHVVVNLHFYDRPLGKFLREYSNITIITDDVDTAPLMSLSDFMIGDYSGVIFDYMHLSKPSVAFVPDMQTYLDESRALYFELSDVYSFVCTDGIDLDFAIHKILNDEHKYTNTKAIYGDYVAVGNFTKVAFEGLMKSFDIDF